MMSEGRKSKVVLLDGRKLDILIQPKLHASELLDLVASHFNLKEKEYFGLTFKDSAGCNHWLQSDRHVLDHDFPKSTGPLLLYLAVRFFVESINYLKDNASVELFYLQAKQAIHKGHVSCDSELVFVLAAYVLQATHGDFTNETNAKTNIKKLAVLPTRTLKENPSISYCEEKILTHYKNLIGYARGSCIVDYMTIVEGLPMYGIHYYEVKDKSGIPWWLGISFKGIYVYDYNDKNVPRRVFAWNHLENIYFRDKKFSVEVHDPKRTSLTRRTFGLSNVNVHSWSAMSSQLTKSIWTMAIAQHQFYLDSKRSKLASSRTMQEIASELSQGSEGLSPNSTKSTKALRSNHARSWSASITRSDLNWGELNSTKLAEKELQEALKERKEILTNELQKKLKQLKELCCREAMITGRLPDDMPLDFDDFNVVPEKLDDSSNIALSTNTVDIEEDVVEVTLVRLEKDYEIQERIVDAYERLIGDMTVDSNVHTLRQTFHRKASKKLKELEKKLNKYRQLSGIMANHPNSICGSDLLRNGSYENRHKKHVSTVGSSPDIIGAMSCDCNSHLSRLQPVSYSSFHLQNSHSLSQGFKPCSTENRQSLIRNDTHSIPPSKSTYRSVDVDSIQGSAFYNIKTAHEITDYDLTFPFWPPNVSRYDRSHRWPPSKHASLEGAYRRANREGRRLDRNLSSGCLECEEMPSSADFGSHCSFFDFSQMKDEIFADSAYHDDGSKCYRNSDMLSAQHNERLTTREENKICNQQFFNPLSSEGETTRRTSRYNSPFNTRPQDHFSNDCVGNCLNENSATSQLCAQRDCGSELLQLTNVHKSGSFLHHSSRVGSAVPVNRSGSFVTTKSKNNSMIEESMKSNDPALHSQPADSCHRLRSRSVVHLKSNGSHNNAVSQQPLPSSIKQTKFSKESHKHL